jgi:CubicO group peptidase (beta-lactamase class C family)
MFIEIAAFLDADPAAPMPESTGRDQKIGWSLGGLSGQILLIDAGWITRFSASQYGVLCSLLHPDEPDKWSRCALGGFACYWGRMRCILVLLASFAVTVPAAAQQPCRLVPPQSERVLAGIAVLDHWIVASVYLHDQPGLSIGIICDGKLIWEKGYGYADLEHNIPAVPSTLYRVASITKLFTATAVLQLRDAAHLQLDDPITRYLPWVKLHNEVPDSPPITISELLLHTSGLPRESAAVNWNTLQWPKRGQLIQALHEQELLFAPGSETRYSNLGYAILGQLIEIVSGERYDQYVSRHILEPLGMNSSAFFPYPNMPHLAVGYNARRPHASRTRARLVLRDATVPNAASGNLVTSVEDLAHFAALQMCEPQNPQRTAEVLRCPSIRDMQSVRWAKPASAEPRGWGFELVREFDGWTHVSHEGGNPGYEGIIDIAPDERLAVIVLSNAPDTNSARYAQQTFEIIDAAIQQSEPRIPAPRNGASYTGNYAWEDEQYDVLVLDGTLAVIDPASGHPWNERTMLQAEGPQRFRGVGGVLDGEVVWFELSPTGNGSRLHIVGQYYVRRP